MTVEERDDTSVSQGHGNKRNYKNKGLRGACEELKENVYIAGDIGAPDKYVKTTEAIALYVQRKWSGGKHIHDTIVKMKEVDMDALKPKELDEKATELDKQIQLVKIKKFVDIEHQYFDNLSRCYGLIYGQTTRHMKDKLEARDDWEEIQEKQQPMPLLNALKEITHQYQANQCPIKTIHQGFETVMTMRQGKGEGLVSYSKRFKNAVDVMEARCGPLSPSAFAPKMKGHPQKDHKKFRENAHSQFLAHRLTAGADPNRSGNILQELNNDFAKGNDNYPQDIPTAVSLLESHQQKRRQNNNENRHNDEPDPETQLGFNQFDNYQRRSGQFQQTGRCYVCGDRTHRAFQCPKRWNPETKEDEATEDDNTTTKKKPVRENVFMALEMARPER